jgi:hypothetical protein
MWPWERHEIESASFVWAWPCRYTQCVKTERTSGKNEWAPTTWTEHSITHIRNESRDSSVGIALGCGLDDRGSRVRFPAGAGNFSLNTASRTALGPTQPPTPWIPGALSLGVKRPEREADHSHPSSAEVEVKKWVELYLHSPNTPSRRDAELKKHRDNFTFYLHWLKEQV